ncbi:T9SS type A sorting domain-containing protein [Flavobacterium sp. GT3R68]|uniref:T9SS type A sorting domain-containing protein n=1 Tax=Flavobacterium sp. GT3R68 TaxID=2594437 RepID=UPI000F89AE3E|nr:T9SS type A sorting domain-containing protein [Flavobacterium sp. GT3R68]RTY93464.1 T9SS type A sorting domain-containing protein [Flavobacterium sp. GSN2]TRW92363.1 T9SS type A sorting domain-containing protein [Flavobacterium sp. GT3R68]
MGRIKHLFWTFILMVATDSSAQDGTLDTTFGNSGVVMTDFGGYLSDIKDIAVLSNGKIITAGGIFNQSGYNKFALLRYNKDGSLDNEFGADGKVINDFGGYYVNGMLQESEGKIIVATREYDYFEGIFASRSFLVQYDKNGILDSTFGVNGVIIKNTNGINSLALLPDGKILAAESYGSTALGVTHSLIRYNSNGNPDSSFGINGAVPITAIGQVALTKDGKILISSSDGNFVFTRYLNDGTLDATFGNNGTLTIDIDVDNLRFVKIQPDNKILFIGRSYHFIDSPYTISDDHYRIFRLLPNGDLDANFGENGMIVLTVSPDSALTDNAPDSIVIQSDGKIVAIGRHPYIDEYGYSLDQIGIVRYLVTGVPDVTFGENSLLLIPNDNLGGGNMSNSTCLQSDGKLVIGSTFCEAHLSCHPHTLLLRYGLGQTLTDNEFEGHKNTFSVYPNPVSQIVNLDFNLNQSEDLSIDLYDVNGRKISNLLKNKNFQSGHNSQQLDLPGTLSKGIYFLSVSDAEYTAVVKIVK